MYKLKESTLHLKSGKIAQYMYFLFTQYNAP